MVMCTAVNIDGVDGAVNQSPEAVRVSSHIDQFTQALK